MPRPHDTAAASPVATCRCPRRPLAVVATANPQRSHFPGKLQLLGRKEAGTVPDGSLPVTRPHHSSSPHPEMVAAGQPLTCREGAAAPPGTLLSLRSRLGSSRERSGGPKDRSETERSSVLRAWAAPRGLRLEGKRPPARTAASGGGVVHTPQGVVQPPPPYGGEEGRERETVRGAREKKKLGFPTRRGWGGLRESVFEGLVNTVTAVACVLSRAGGGAGWVGKGRG